jgi:hypothetical protein
MGVDTKLCYRTYTPHNLWRAKRVFVRFLSETWSGLRSALFRAASCTSADVPEFVRVGRAGECAAAAADILLRFYIVRGAALTLE